MQIIARFSSTEVQVLASVVVPENFIQLRVGEERIKRGGGGEGVCIQLISVCWLAWKSAWMTGILAAVELYKQSVLKNHKKNQVGGLEVGNR